MNDFIKSGSIAAKTREYAKKLIKEGLNIYDYVIKVEEKIKNLGGSIGFPVNISINEDAAHNTADYKSEKVFKPGDLVKVDIGTHVNGFIGDTAFTAEITTNKYTDLIKASEKALSEALKIIKPGTRLCEIGRVIEETIKSFGYNPIRNLGGHGVKQYDLHAGLFIPNFDNGNNNVLKDDDTIAVEPFATTGEGRVSNSNTTKIFALQGIKPTRLMSARSIQKYVAREFKTLPFAEHHLLSKFKPVEVSLGLRELNKIGALHAYPILTETSKGMVSQAEHTLLVKDKPIITTLI